MSTTHNVLDIIRKARETRIAAEAAVAKAASNVAAAAHAQLTTTSAAVTTTSHEPVVAQKATAVVFKAGAFDEELGVVTAFASAAGIVDRDNDRISQSDLAAMAYGFTGGSERVFKANHGDPIQGVQLVGSIIGAPILKSGRTLALGEELPPQTDSDERVAKGEAVDPVIGMNVEKGKATHWMVDLALGDPQLIAKAKAGEIAGLSVGIRGVRTPAAE